MLAAATAAGALAVGLAVGSSGLVSDGSEGATPAADRATAAPSSAPEAGGGSGKGGENKGGNGKGRGNGNGGRNGNGNGDDEDDD